MDQVTESYVRFETISKSDTVNIPAGTTDAIYVGGGGTVQIVWGAGFTQTIVGVPTGTFLKVRARRVNSGTTTATSMVACYLTDAKTDI